MKILLAVITVLSLTACGSMSKTPSAATQKQVERFANRN